MIDKAVERCQNFATKHKLIFEDTGTVGFDRPCVGFIRGSGYIDYNPLQYPDFSNVWPHDHRLGPPAGVEDAYHKHDCLAVLVHEENYGVAIDQLAAWVDHLESQGEVEVVEYATGATGVHAFMTGAYHWAVRIKIKEV